MRALTLTLSQGDEGTQVPQKPTGCDPWAFFVARLVEIALWGQNAPMEPPTDNVTEALWCRRPACPLTCRRPSGARDAGETPAPQPALATSRWCSCWRRRLPVSCWIGSGRCRPGHGRSWRLGGLTVWSASVWAEPAGRICP